MEAYADPLKYYEPDPPNTTNPKEVAERLAVNDEEVCNEEDDNDDNDENLDERIDDNDTDTVFNKILTIEKLDDIEKGERCEPQQHCGHGREGGLSSSSSASNLSNSSSPPPPLVPFLSSSLSKTFCNI